MIIVVGSKKLRVFSHIVIPLIIVSIFFIICGSGFILWKYPWMATSIDFNHTRSFAFAEPWPQNPLVQEVHDKKKKKFPRNELERIYSLDLRRMEYLNVPILDMLQNGQTKFSTADEAFRSFGFAEYPWPWFETKRSLGDVKSFQKVSYILQPSPRGLSLTEGILFAPGDELEVNIPLTPLRRSVKFYILPFNTGTLRFSIGKYLWTRSFVDADINQIQLINIPINDSVTTQIKILPNSARFFLLQPKVTQSEMSGRIPIQLSTSSNIWKPNPALIRQSNMVATENIEDTSEANEAVKLLPSEKLDSLKTDSNSQVMVPRATSAAVGYNLLFVHVNDISWKIFNNPELVAKIAPELHDLMNKSLIFPQGINLESDLIRDFRSVVLGKEHANFKLNDTFLLQHELENSNSFNIYRHVRDFGYHTVSIAPAKVFGMNSDITKLDNATILGERWLDPNDWNFARRRLKIDRDAQPLRGLEAVLGKEQSLSAPLVTSDYASLRDYLERVATATPSFPDWGANEIQMPDDREVYAGSVLDYFDNWTNSNRQQRFLFHIWLNVFANNSRPSIKDLLTVAKKLKIMGLINEFSHGELARVAMLNRTVGQMLDILRVRRLTHRTIVVMCFEHKDLQNAEARKGSALIYLPGVKPVNNQTIKNIGLNDLVATSLSAAGIPLYVTTNTGGFSYPGKNVEEVGENITKPESLPVPPWRNKLYRFVFNIKPGKFKCSPLIWRSLFPIFGLQATHPIIETQGSKQEFVIYPCAINADLITLTWYQMANIELDITQPPDSLIGGKFIASQSSINKNELVKIFWGERILDMANPIFFTNGSYASVLNRAIEAPISSINDAETEKILKLAMLAAVVKQDTNSSNNDNSSALLVRQAVEN